MTAYLNRKKEGGFELSFISAVPGTKNMRVEKLHVASRKEANAICKARGAEGGNFFVK